MPEDQDQKPHLVVRTPPDRYDYTAHGGGGGSKPVLERSRDQHGARLQSEIGAVEQVNQQVEQARTDAGLPSEMDHVVEFVVRPNPALEIQSLENMQSGIRLLSVTPGPQEGLLRGNVAVPRGKLRIFENKVGRYLDHGRDSQEGMPKHARLINSIEVIRRAVFESLWNDPIEPAPPGDAAVLWWEIWTPDAARFREHAAALGLDVPPKTLRFPERDVVLLHATRDQLSSSAGLLDSIAEIRAARAVETRFFLDLPPGEQSEWISDLADRIEGPAEGAPRVCLLDTGVDIGHSLLSPALTPADALTYEPGWGPDDRHGHGTQMAGLALYGERLHDRLADQQAVRIRHGLESVKMIPVGHSSTHDPDLYGEVARECIARAEQNADRRRLIVSSITGSRSPAGIPTSWSAALDLAAVGERELDEPRRLVIAAVGNVDLSMGYDYPSTNFAQPVDDPSQAWNVLTVGAFTKRDLLDPSRYPGWRVVAPAGDLGPASSTTASWPSDDATKRPPVKPDILVEGGNMALDPTSGQPQAVDDLMLLTTRRRMTGSSSLTSSGDTSAAASIAGWVAAELVAEYPSLWPETIRALMVHSARWTPAMIRRFGQQLGRNTAKELLRHYGYGVLDADRAMYCAAASPTLVYQQELQPYDWKLDDEGRKTSETTTQDMHLHRLPWPREVLTQLGPADIQLRVTLSYFVEPGPGERGWGNRYRYPSVGLRFRTCTTDELEEDFRRRLNKEESGPRSRHYSDADKWLLGDACFAGSVHSDVWTGSAAELADKDLIAVHPVSGWWRYRKHLGRVQATGRYALIVSIETEELGAPVDLYTPIRETVDIGAANIVTT